MNPMKDVKIEKVTLNVGIGQAGQELENGKRLLEMLSGSQAVPTKAKVRNPVFRIKKGDLIGAKTTLRGKGAKEFLEKALQSKDNTLSARSFDDRGNFSFGVSEYIEFPGTKYDPKIGMMGFDVCVTLTRKGARVAKRKRAKRKVGKKHSMGREDGIEFAKSALNVNIKDEKD